MWTMPLHTAVLSDRRQSRPDWLLFGRPHKIITTSRREEIIGSLQHLEHCAARGAYAVGFIAYEAAAAFDAAFPPSAPPADFPLVWFGLYDRAERIGPPPCLEGQFELAAWRASISVDEYHAAICRIKRAIESGDTYQVNYTFRLRGAFRGDPWALFLALQEAQYAPYAAYLNLGRFHICSVSPELFFSRSNDLLVCRPMKGTAPPDSTGAGGTQLSSSLKNRAENVMIVDMVRNDLGKIAAPGSVRVEELFAVENYATVLQMTSTISAHARVSLVEILRGLFPAASITGAPKIKTMELIGALESGPRGLYTGCIGFISPEQDAQFSVAIRTAIIDTQSGVAEYGTGSGIVWDSDADQEYAECLLKTAILPGSLAPSHS
jgi:para-aminobenzoate synthetase/4-amino-4-deoxychorismate lyase